ncbi:GPO family capsid scaffolding protein [Methylomonas sp. EFPC3]|uniref:GPO family capsid scaffolding protein n=1 Tax=Methylomonas sp. EFPC3 TaxID=3021710 RepID=UPI00241665F8|nr:GPO family capsid scaffolding protein [Methylomonas sp. EFPC3]WFP48522.1 GPO family capsid scaffolding protein [Methylomonas sp. EFPC3]
MADRVLRTDYKRIGRSGQTVDGRVIDPAWIDQMAETYNKELFTALIWPDHSRWMNYGVVEELRATDNEEGGRDLWAVLSPNQSYLSDNRYGQRLFTSMEITFDFRKSGKAYLTGLGATDDPASVGTTEIRFSKLAKQAGVELSAFIEAETKTFTDQRPESLLDQIKALFNKNQTHEDDDMATKAEIAQMNQGLEDLKAMFSKLTGGKPTDDKAPGTELTASEQRIVAAVVSQFRKQPEEEKPTDDPKPGNDFAAFTKQIVDAIHANFGKKPEDNNGAEAADPKALKDLQAQFAALKKQLDDALQEQPGTDGGEHFGNQGDASHLE